MTSKHMDTERRVLLGIAAACAVALVGLVAFGIWAALRPATVPERIPGDRATAEGEASAREDSPELTEGDEGRISGEDYASVAASAGGASASGAEPYAGSDSGGFHATGGTASESGSGSDAAGVGDADTPPAGSGGGQQGSDGDSGSGSSPEQGGQGEDEKPAPPQSEWGPVV